MLSVCSCYPILAAAPAQPINIQAISPPVQVVITASTGKRIATHPGQKILSFLELLTRISPKLPPEISRRLHPVLDRRGQGCIEQIALL